jgi:hypothetical protein
LSAKIGAAPNQTPDRQIHLQAKQEQSCVRYLGRGSLVFRRAGRAATQRLQHGNIGPRVSAWFLFEEIISF